MPRLVPHRLLPELRPQVVPLSAVFSNSVADATIGRTGSIKTYTYEIDEIRLKVFLFHTGSTEHNLLCNGQCHRRETESRDGLFRVQCEDAEVEVPLRRGDLRAVME